MSNSKKRKKRKKDETIDKNNNTSSMKVAILSSLITSAIIAGINICINVMNTNFIVSELRTSTADNSALINKLIGSNEANISRISDLEREQNSYRDISFIGKPFSVQVGQDGIMLEHNNVSIVGASSDDIAIDKVTNEKYSLDDLAETRILTTYEENGMHIVFYGQYDYQGRWDGLCVINAYENDVLKYITEAQYVSGRLDSYYQIFEDKRGFWVESSRIITENGAAGITRKYSGSNDYKTGIDYSNISPKDVIGTYQLLSMVNTKLLSCYNGYTKDGLYEDNTGNAYYISFFNDGTVKTLYVGKFREGQFCDSSNDSWYISKEENTDYMFYKGSFNEDGNPTRGEGTVFINNLTQGQIDEILRDNLKIEIGTELIWKNDIDKQK